MKLFKIFYKHQGQSDLNKKHIYVPAIDSQDALNCISHALEFEYVILGGRLATKNEIELYEKQEEE